MKKDGVLFSELPSLVPEMSKLKINESRQVMMSQYRKKYKINNLSGNIGIMLLKLYISNAT